jgi:hypothetical protein
MEGKIDTKRSGYDKSFRSIPPLNIILRPQTQTLPDGTIERYYPHIFHNTPYFSFVTSLLYFHEYKYRIKDFINRLNKKPKLQKTTEGTRATAKSRDIQESPNILEYSVKINKNCPKEISLFHHEGAFWTIIFRGDKLPPIQNLVGMRCLNVLLNHPGREFRPIDLYQLSIGGKVLQKNEIKHEINDLNQATGSGEKLGKSDVDNVINTEVEQNLERRLIELEQEMDDAEQRDDIERYEKAEKEKEEIERYHKKAKAIGGRVRQFSNQHNNARTNLQTYVSI